MKIVIVWQLDDVIAAAENNGIHITMKQAEEWLKINEKGLRDVFTQHGNEVLSESIYGVDWSQFL